MTVPVCPCGETHEERRFYPQVRRMIEQLGELEEVSVLGVGRYMVPRLYIAYHGFRGHELPALATKYGWEST